MKVVNINRVPTLESALGALDELRAKLAAGEIVSFFAIGIYDGDAIEGFVGSSKPVSRLRMTGALANALHDFNQGLI